MAPSVKEAAAEERLRNPNLYVLRPRPDFGKSLFYLAVSSYIPLTIIFIKGSKLHFDVNNIFNLVTVMLLPLFADFSSNSSLVIPFL